MANLILNHKKTQKIHPQEQFYFTVSMFLKTRQTQKIPSTNSVKEDQHYKTDRPLLPWTSATEKSIKPVLGKNRTEPLGAIPLIFRPNPIPVYLGT